MWLLDVKDAIFCFNVKMDLVANLARPQLMFETWFLSSHNLCVIDLKSFVAVWGNFVVSTDGADSVICFSDVKMIVGLLVLSMMVLEQILVSLIQCFALAM